jgi:ParB family chromosome partitioning protein
MGKKRDTGRGNAANQPLDGALLVPIGRIRVSATQPRRWFAQRALETLATSIRERGIIQPLRVRPDPAAPGRYILVVGERRLRAAALAGLTAVPVVVRALSSDQALLDGLAENVSRVDLANDELVESYRLLRERGHSDRRIAAAIGVSHSTIGRLIRVADDALLCEAVGSGRLTMSLAWEILTLDDDAKTLAIGLLAERRETGAPIGRDVMRPLIESLRRCQAAPAWAPAGADPPPCAASPRAPAPVSDAPGGRADAPNFLGGEPGEGDAVAEARAAGRARALRRYAEDQLALLAPFTGRGLVEEDLRAILALLLELYPGEHPGALGRL